MSETQENPKLIRALKEGKAPLEYLVLDVLEEDAHVHALGGLKYGIRNWRRDKIKASTYKAAILRHFIAWFGGEDTDPESGKSHLAHVRACCAILRDSQMHGTLIDDRHLVESRDQDTNELKTFDRGALDEFLTVPCSSDDFTIYPLLQDMIAIESQLKTREELTDGPGWYVEFKDGRPSDSLNFWHAVVGPFPNLEEARQHAQMNPDKFSGVRTIFNVK